MNNWFMFSREKQASVIIWARVTSTKEKTPCNFIEKGVKVNQHLYLDFLKEKFVSWIISALGECGKTLQQVGATSHSANRV